MSQCFILETTGYSTLWARRYTSGTYDCECVDRSYHNNRNLFGRRPTEGSVSYDGSSLKDILPFPTHCVCGYEFNDESEWQIFAETEYHIRETGEILFLGDAPDGAIWHAHWLDFHQESRGIDLKAYQIKIGGISLVLDDINYCGRKYPHKCWIRTGTPPNITLTRNEECEGSSDYLYINNSRWTLIDGQLNKL